MNRKLVLTNILMKLILITAFYLFIFHPPILAQPATTLTTYLNSIRQGSHTPVPQTLLEDTANEATLLNALPSYQNDTLTAVRSRAYNIAKRIGQKSANLPVRQTATAQLMRGIADPDAGISGNASTGLTGFRPEDFSPATREQLIAQLQVNTPHLDQVALLAGFLQPPKAQPMLQQLLTAQVSPTTRWAIRLALARIGDEAAIDYILNKLSTAPVNDALVYDIVPGLVYTRQPAIFNYLKDLIMSEEANCQSADPDASQNILCGYRVMEQLAPALEDFPVAVDAYGELVTDDYEQSLQEVRAWLSDREAYRMKQEIY